MDTIDEIVSSEDLWVYTSNCESLFNALKAARTRADVKVVIENAIIIYQLRKGDIVVWPDIESMTDDFIKMMEKDPETFPDFERNE